MEKSKRMCMCVCMWLYGFVYLFNCVSVKESNSTQNRRNKRKRTVNIGYCSFTLTNLMQNHSLLLFVYSISNISRHSYVIVTHADVFTVAAVDAAAYQNSTMENSIHMKIDQMDYGKENQVQINIFRVEMLFFIQVLSFSLSLCVCVRFFTLPYLRKLKKKVSMSFINESLMLSNNRTTENKGAKLRTWTSCYWRAWR